MTACTLSWDRGKDVQGCLLSRRKCVPEQVATRLTSCSIQTSIGGVLLLADEVLAMGLAFVSRSCIRIWASAPVVSNFLLSLVNATLKTLALWRENESQLLATLSFVVNHLLSITVDPPYLALGCSSLSLSNVFHNRTRLSSPPEASQVPEPFEHVRALTQLLWASRGV